MPAAMRCLPRWMRFVRRWPRRGWRWGSHDDTTQAQRAGWRARGVTVAEFPETLEAAEAAKSAGDHVVLGAPNVVRGGITQRQCQRA